MQKLDPTFERVLLSHIKKEYLPDKKKKSFGANPFNDKDLQFFAKGAEKLSDYFTEERNALLPNYLNDPVLRSGYLLYFLPLNLSKAEHVVRTLPEDTLVSGKIRILDLASGPGTSSLGFMSAYADFVRQKKVKEVSLDFTLIDQNYHILQDAKMLHDAYRDGIKKNLKGFDSSLTSRAYDLRRPKLARTLGNFKYHYIFVSNFLNELSEREDILELVQDLVANHLDPQKGRLILIEPALRHPSRMLQWVRDSMIAKGASVHAPCLHQSGCPLNVNNQRDWCHFYVPWEAPAFIQKTDKLIGNKNDWLKMSYMVLAPWALKTTHEDTSWRVISNLMRSKGKKELVICGQHGRYQLHRQDKDRSATNFEVDSIQRGDVVSYGWDDFPQGYTAAGKRRIESEDVIHRLKP
jgi:hypothetical protein